MSDVRSGREFPAAGSVRLPEQPQEATYGPRKTASGDQARKTANSPAGASTASAVDRAGNALWRSMVIDDTTARELRDVVDKQLAKLLAEFAARLN